MAPASQPTYSNKARQRARKTLVPPAVPVLTKSAKQKPTSAPPSDSPSVSLSEPQVHEASTSSELLARAQPQETLQSSEPIRNPDNSTEEQDQPSIAPSHGDVELTTSNGNPQKQFRDSESSMTYPLAPEMEHQTVADDADETIDAPSEDPNGHADSAPALTSSAISSPPYEAPNEPPEWPAEVDLNSAPNQPIVAGSSETAERPYMNGTLSPAIALANGHPPPSSEADTQAHSDGSRTLPTSLDSTRPPADTITNRPVDIAPLTDLHSHLLQLCNTKEWADWIIYVVDPQGQAYGVYAHSFVLTRSSRLRKTMERPPAGGFQGNVINLQAPRQIKPHAFEAALRFLYSDSILASDAILPNSTSVTNGIGRLEALDYLLSYGIAGLLLGIGPVVTRATTTLAGLVDWDTIEWLLREASSLTAMREPTRDEDNDQAQPSEALAAAKLWRDIGLQFCFRHLEPATFRLDAAYSSTLVPSRLGHLEDTRSKHNPALASMVFGSMPSSADLSPVSPQSETMPAGASVEDQIASNIILNLAFEELKVLDDTLRQKYGKAGEHLMSDIVSERENRRLRVVSNRAVPNKQRMTSSADWDVAGFREYYHGGSLHRERVGFLLPTKPR